MRTEGKNKRAVTDSVPRYSRSPWLMAVRLFTCCLIGASLSTVTAGVGLGQSASSADEIDGAKTPYLIPDLIAYRLVMLSLAVPASPSETDLFKQEARLQRMSLSEADRAKLKMVADRFAAELETWARTAPAAAFSMRDEIVRRYVRILDAELTSDGLNSFRAYVMGEKSKMRIPR